jgi:hypothetical protein
MLEGDKDKKHNTIEKGQETHVPSTNQPQQIQLNPRSGTTNQFWQAQDNSTMGNIFIHGSDMQQPQQPQQQQPHYQRKTSVSPNEIQRNDFDFQGFPSMYRNENVLPQWMDSKRDRHDDPLHENDE